MEYGGEISLKFHDAIKARCPNTTLGRKVLARYGLSSWRTGILPVMADGLPACRFNGGQIGCAVCHNWLEACYSIKGRKTDRIGHSARYMAHEGRMGGA